MSHYYQELQVSISQFTLPPQYMHHKKPELFILGGYRPFSESDESYRSSAQKNFIGNTDKNNFYTIEKTHSSSTHALPSPQNCLNHRLRVPEKKDSAQASFRKYVCITYFTLLSIDMKEKNRVGSNVSF